MTSTLRLRPLTTTCSALPLVRTTTNTLNVAVVVVAEVDAAAVIAPVPLVIALTAVLREVAARVESW